MAEHRRRDWFAPPDLKTATHAQREIAETCETTDRFGRVGRAAGADTSSAWRDTRGPIHAAIATLAWPDAVAGEAAAATRIPPFPYVPGYLGFREAPSLLAAWDKLPEKPDLLFVDGQGRSHPRRCGIATHVGVLLDVPTIGVAKTLLCGAVEGEVGPAPGDRAPLIDRGETVGVALRTRARAAPIYISTGHRVSLETSVEWVLKLTDGRRLPLPIRLAHEAANAQRRAMTDQMASA
ncbi:MAG: endonuclease V [Sphingomonadaceae bacterium]|nr:endonuclease V [Sphingomonadaceae bacterium]